MKKASPLEISDNVFDSFQIAEASVLINEMLRDPSIQQPHIIQELRTLKGLLTSSNMSARLSIVPYDEDDDENALNRDRARIRGSITHMRRLSTSVWTTTTTAAGMPTVELEPANRNLQSPEARRSLDNNQSHGHEEPEYEDDPFSTLPNNVKKALYGEVSDLELEANAILKDLNVFHIMHDKEIWKNLNNWNFEIFELREKCPIHPLTVITYKVFQKTHMFDLFRIPIAEFFRFFSKLESGYHPKNHYHNRLHAADVMQSVYWLVTQNIPCVNGDYMVIEDKIPSIELLSLLSAAAMHDYDHPGRTNAFLVDTQDPLAILYNDRAVLESHHAASAWKLLTSEPKNNFVKNLDKAEFKRFRFLILEAILATDLKRHFEFLAALESKLADEDGCCFDWSNEIDRLLYLQLCIKLADIAGPSKKFSIHSQWTECICNEFYEQGDHEARLNLPISKYMDRKNPQKAKLQVNFIGHVVGPLCENFSNAFLVPGDLEPIQENGLTSDGDGSISSQRVSITSVLSEEFKKRPNFVAKNLISTQVRENLAHWQKVVRSEEDVNRMPSTE